LGPASQAWIVDEGTPVSTERRHFSPAETAERLGVSVKALRVYERQEMVAPLRTAAGWRTYGPDQIARLHQILALKGLGLSLGQIAELLANKPVDLDRLLALQEEALASHRQRLDQALRLLRSARAKLKAGDVLSIDDLTTLAKETTMSDPMTDQEAKALFEPLGEKYFTPQELQSLKARNFGADEQTIATSAWAKLTEECKLLMAKGDPTSPDAMDLAARWSAQVAKFTQGDPALAEKATAMWKDAMSNPVAAPRLPVNPEMFAFIGKADAARKAAAG
jgi:DNA-binding transcriptional MerR regulator